MWSALRHTRIHKKPGSCLARRPRSSRAAYFHNSAAHLRSAPSSAVSSGALDGVRVLDLSRVLAGPWATQLLADMGAEVIKVEKPGVGDDTRRWGPPFLTDDNGNVTNESAYFICANRNKKSITLDFAHPKGADIIRRLAKESDVLVENYKADGLKKYGLDYESLSKVNPRLIYCSITGFGQTGPRKYEPGYDFIIQGIGGLMSITGEQDGAPMKVGVAVVDLMTGLYASNAILAALFNRTHTNQGQYIDLSLFDVQIAMLANQGLNYLVSGTPPQRMGNQHPNIAPYSTIRTKDGYIILAVGSDEQFIKVCNMIDRPDLARDPRFSTNRARVLHRNELYSLLDDIFSKETKEYWLAKLRSINVSAGPINDIAEVFDDPQAKARQARVEIGGHPLRSSIPVLANPIKFSNTQVKYRLPPPTLGQHTREILSNILGLNELEIEQLYNEGVI